jgi:hypothetical protein
MGAKNSTFEGVDEVKQLTNRKIISFCCSLVRATTDYLRLFHPVTDEEIRAVYEQFMRKYPNGEMTKEVRNQNIY